MPLQILPQALKQIGTDAIGTGRGQLGEPARQRIAAVARVAGPGHPIGVKEQRAAGRE